MALVLPSLYSELEGPALSGIVDEISKVRYLEQVIVGLDRATKEEFVKAINFFRRMPQQPTILWNDGPRLRKLISSYSRMAWHQISPAKGGTSGICLAMCWPRVEPRRWHCMTAISQPTTARCYRDSFIQSRTLALVISFVRAFMRESRISR